MNRNNKFFDDMQKMAGAAMHSMSLAKKETEKMFKEFFAAQLKKHDFVMRDEFEALKSVVYKMVEGKPVAAKAAKPAAKPKAAPKAVAKKTSVKSKIKK